MRNKSTVIEISPDFPKGEIRWLTVGRCRSEKQNILRSAAEHKLADKRGGLFLYSKMKSNSCSNNRDLIVDYFSIILYFILQHFCESTEVEVVRLKAKQQPKIPLYSKVSLLYISNITVLSWLATILKNDVVSRRLWETSPRAPLLHQQCHTVVIL